MWTIRVFPLFRKTVGGIGICKRSPGGASPILTKDGVVRGITGRRAIHLLNAEERKKNPGDPDLWIDIGAKSKEATQGAQTGGASEMWVCMIHTF